MRPVYADSAALNLEFRQSRFSRGFRHFGLHAITDGLAGALKPFKHGIQIKREGLGDLPCLAIFEIMQATNGLERIR